jgi:thioredoxin 1
MEQIILWESRGEMIRACELAVHQALKELGIKAVVTVNSEPPLIGRHHLWERLPVLEIQGLHWSLRPGCACRVGDLKLLFSKVFGSQIERPPGKNFKETGLKECHAKEVQETMENIELTDSDFKARLEQTTGLLLFYKKRCPNCRALEKMLEKFLSANAHIAYMRIDSEECPEAMKAFGTERVPAIFLLRDGQIVAKKVGLMNLGEMTDFYQSA